MEWKEIKSYDDLQMTFKESDKTFVLLFKKGSETSSCAVERLENQKVEENMMLLKVNVAETLDIHKEYNITTVPSLLQFENGDLKNVIKGCMTEDYYNSVINGIYNKVIIKNGDVEKQKRVVVYGTPSCTWCTRIKDYFNEKSIKFEYVDVAANQVRMEEMKNKSGQMGVPQTEIGGQMIVGFDKPKINRLLGL